MLACSLPDLEVATFNLYEWNVGANNRWGALYDKIQSQSFDVIGFQEATGISRVINAVPRMRLRRPRQDLRVGRRLDGPDGWRPWNGRQRPSRDLRRTAAQLAN